MTKFLLLLVAVLVATSCTPVRTMPPAVTPVGADRFLVDPRTGYDAPISPELNRRFEAAWRYVLSGDEAEARRRFVVILAEDPGFLPAMLAQAALDIRAGQFDKATAAVRFILEKNPHFMAARVYDAEIATRHQLVIYPPRATDSIPRTPYELYRRIAADPNAPPTALERVAQLGEAMFAALYAAAQTAPDAEAIPLLREALTVNAGAIEPRVLLAQKLLAQRQFDEARREIDPLLDTIADRPDIQSLLAEVEVGRGRYQDAIVRYDRIVKRTKDPRYQARLEAVKREWSAANMPTHFRTALTSEAVTRAELATLLYWTVPSVRFAQNLGTPPIAVDIEDLDGREEIIRAIALGLFDVDPVTRRVSPHRHVTASRLSTFLARVLAVRGAACARGITADRVLATCLITDPLVKYAPDEPVFGQDAETALEQIAKHL